MSLEEEKWRNEQKRNRLRICVKESPALIVKPPKVALTQSEAELNKLSQQQETANEEVVSDEEGFPQICKVCIRIEESRGSVNRASVSSREGRSQGKGVTIMV